MPNLTYPPGRLDDLPRVKCAAVVSGDEICGEACGAPATVEITTHLARDYTAAIWRCDEHAEGGAAAAVGRGGGVPVTMTRTG